MLAVSISRQLKNKKQNNENNSSLSGFGFEKYLLIRNVIGLMHTIQIIMRSLRNMSQQRTFFYLVIEVW